MFNKLSTISFSTLSPWIPMPLTSYTLLFLNLTSMSDSVSLITFDKYYSTSIWLSMPIRKSFFTRHSMLVFRPQTIWQRFKVRLETLSTIDKLLSITGRLTSELTMLHFPLVSLVDNNLLLLKPFWLNSVLCQPGQVLLKLTGNF